MKQSGVRQVCWSLTLTVVERKQVETCMGDEDDVRMRGGLQQRKFLIDRKTTHCWDLNQQRLTGEEGMETKVRFNLYNTFQDEFHDGLVKT